MNADTKTWLREIFFTGPRSQIASKVFFLVDAHDNRSTPRVASRDVNFMPGTGMVDFRHSGAANILFYDGHVELQKESSCVIKHGQPDSSG